MGLVGSWRNINQKQLGLMTSIWIAKSKRKIKFYNEEVLPAVKALSKTYWLIWSIQPDFPATLEGYERRRNLSEMFAHQMAINS